MSNKSDIASFVTAIMDIKAVPMLGGASAGIAGMTSMSSPAVNEIKSTVIAFAAAYRKNAHGETTLQLGKKLEGQLATLQVLSALTSSQYDQLVSDLRDLTESAAAGR